jgi:hypothetical protein
LHGVLQLSAANRSEFIYHAALSIEKILDRIDLRACHARQLRAQEVVVAREPKSNAPERVAPLSKVMDAESETATQTKFQVREKKSASMTLTVEQMRKAEALAADRQKQELPVEQTNTTRISDSQPVVGAFATPRQKKGISIEKTNIGRVTHSQPRKSEPAAIRPTMIESQSEEPASSPPAKAERSGMRTNPAQSASVPLRKKETRMSRPMNSQLREEDPTPLHRSICEPKRRSRNWPIVSISCID